MPRIPHTLHVAIDYVSVVVFLVAPTVLGLTVPGTVLCYALAGAHLAVTVVTAAPGGLVPVLPTPVHGGIERVVGIALLVGPWLTGDLFGSTGRAFFTVMGAALLVVGFLTDYHAPTAQAADAAPVPPDPGSPRGESG